MHRVIIRLLLSLFVFSSAYASTALAGRPTALEDYESIRSPYLPQVSPDGKRIIFSLDTQIYLAAADGSEPLALTSAATRSWEGRWSVDGESIYFVSDRDGTTQIHELSLDNPGEAAQMTHFKHGVASMNFSPDETRILLSVSDNALLEVDEEADPKPFVINRRQFKKDEGDGYIVDGDTTHLYVYDVETTKMEQITTGGFNESEAAWSPDGESIVFVSNREDDPDTLMRTDLWIVAADPTTDEHTLSRLTDSDRFRYSPTFSPDGNEIAYLSAITGPYGLYNLTVVPAAGGEPRILTTELDRWVISFEYSENGEWIYFNYYDSGAQNLARIRVRDAKIEKLIEGEQLVSSFDLGGSGVVAATIYQSNSAANIFSLRRKTLTQLTDLNREFFEEVDLGNKMKVSFENADGILIESFITTPPDYDSTRRYPAILNVHGGPQGQHAWGYSFATQYFASNGYVVIEPNPRGSLGRGQEFLSSIYRSWGVPDYHDVIESVDFAIEAGIADPDRLSVTGFSYGGYMTNVVITETDRFKAAASGAGHSLIEANFGHDIYQGWYMWELGVPWENREKYDVHSPLLRAGNVTTPTIFLGGRIDWNVPVINAELFYQSLKIKGVDTQLIVYPDAHHGGWPASFEIDYLERVVGWFDLHAKGGSIN